MRLVGPHRPTSRRPLNVLCSAPSRRHVSDEWLRGFWTSENAQDLAEYALLALFIGLAGIAVWGGIANLIGLNYAGYRDDVPALWEPPPP